ncbi:MAG TPA: hypothetical protein VFL86_13080, partial [Burkholderiaceae bacterium]|nr:hypothetical protein [Burkholderiaceae bacterium]
KLQVERGLDFLLKLQSNRIAEAMRTVGQWVLYEPVPQPTPERPRVEPVRRWRQAGTDPLGGLAEGPLGLASCRT